MTAGDVSSNANAFHAQAAEHALAVLQTRPEGLRHDEAAARLERYGPNRLRAQKQTSAWHILRDQVQSLVVLLLFAAATIALLLGDAVEALAIGAVLLINTALGFTTELRARRAMEALLRLEAPRARVLRDGEEHEIDSADLVPGDVVKLEAGDAVTADARLLETAELRCSEAALTGESTPVAKDADADVSRDALVAERPTMVFKGTTVVAGSGRALVVGTGMSTELGRIGGLIGSIAEEQTPLERRLNQLGKRLIAITAAVTAVVVAVGWLRGEPLGRMLETGIALAIAAVPEGLPAVATIALAVGLRRMARRNALIRRLPAVEALGSTTVVCTDKTGTLTAGEMTVTAIVAADREVEVTGVGYAPDGEFRSGDAEIDPHSDPVLRAIVQTAALTARAEISRDNGNWLPLGDPTDAALLVLARKAGSSRQLCLERFPQVGEVPFASERQFMASFHRDSNGETATIAHVKGAPHRVLEQCDKYITSDGEQRLDEPACDRFLEANEALAGRGLRVLALAHGQVAEPAESALRGLTLLALVGMIDPPARGVKETIGRFRTAGIRTVMITGDQRRTAEAIARDLGVLEEDEDTLDGRELQQLSEAELAGRVARIGTYSRVSPEDKVKIIAALERSGEIVAMLGDGVNDAAALKKADVGVAMGIRGTDVAKETAAVVLQDDRFTTIAAAIEEGRVIFDNIRKFIFYLFSCNLAEVLVLFIAGLIGWPLPLLPLQILWLNLVTDTFPALSLALEPAESRVMERPPRDPNAAILSRRFVGAISFYAALITAVTLGAFFWKHGMNADDYEGALTMAFTTLALAQLFHLGNARSQHPVLRPGRVIANRYALTALAIVLVLQMLAIYWAPLAELLEVRALSLSELAVALGLAAIPAVVGQLLRLFGRES